MRQFLQDETVKAQGSGRKSRCGLLMCLESLAFRGPCAVKRVGRETVGFPRNGWWGEVGVPDTEYRVQRISPWRVVLESRCMLWLIRRAGKRAPSRPVVDRAGSWSDIALNDTRAGCLKPT